MALSQGKPDAMAAVETLAQRINVHKQDFERWQVRERRTRRWWLRLGMAVLLPVFFALGVLVEKEFVVIALEDPTGGWRDHVWARYGREIVDCVQAARGEGGEVACTVKVRPP